MEERCKGELRRPNVRHYCEKPEPAIKEGFGRDLMKLRSLSLLLSLCFVAGCETMPEGIQQARFNMAASIQSEPPGDYFIGRRYYKQDYHFWGYVRRPGQP
jgi:hypothetical protein